MESRAVDLYDSNGYVIEDSTTMERGRQIVKQRVKKLIPPATLSFIRTHRERTALNRVGRIACDTATLSRSIDHPKLREVFTSHRINSEWPEVDREISMFSIPDSAEGVNP